MIGPQKKGPANTQYDQMCNSFAILLMFEPWVFLT